MENLITILLFIVAFGYMAVMIYSSLYSVKENKESKYERKLYDRWEKIVIEKCMQCCKNDNCCLFNDNKNKESEKKL